MATKKDFTNGLDGMLQRMEQKPTQTAEPKQATVDGHGKQQEGMYKRATFIIDATLLQGLKAASYEETGRQGQKVTITAVLEDAIRDYLKKRSKRNSTSENTTLQK